MKQQVAAQFLKNFVKSAPYKIHAIMTYNEIQFINRTISNHDTSSYFDTVYQENRVRHGQVKAVYPWTNGRVEMDEQNH
jgi:hypothetical protein